ncbi:c-type cytochrome [Pikeienuella sp. HZG-20]|uniref:c-type cytochrome n=1 Tax=Paludibacillus litoralis TaxID=3133267 RepID=UPI0030EB286F
MKKAFLPALALAPVAALAAPLVDYVVEDAASIPAPLAEWSGDPGPGAALYAAAGCAGCHDGDGAPDFAEMGARLSAGEIRLMIVEPRIVDPETAMPAYYTPGKAGEAPDELVGRTRLTALEIEQIVAFLTAGAAP